MNWDKAFHYILEHNAAIIQWVVVGFVGLLLAVLGLNIFGRAKPREEDLGLPRAKGGHDHGDLAERMVEEALRESGPMAAGAGVASSAAPAAAPSAAAAAEVLALQKELASRSQEIEALKNQVTTSKSAQVDTSSFQKKIQDLEAKLLEYEILEDDIADLSLYKEENARLKEEVRKLGHAGAEAGASPSANPAPAPSVAASVPPQASEAIVEEFAAAVEDSKKPVAEPAPEEPTPVEESKKSAVEPEEPPAVAAAKPKASESPEGEAAEGDDLLTEFAASIGESIEEPAGENFDTDKMIAEMADLTVSGAEGDSDLDAETDMEKMAGEASKLLGN